MAYKIVPGRYVISPKKKQKQKRMNLYVTLLRLQRGKITHVLHYFQDQAVLTEWYQ